MTAPDFLPVLSHGAHHSPEDGACVMELVSMLAGEPFSDTPKCTNPLLAEVARCVNDSLLDVDRHLLVPLIPRLFGTNNQSRDVIEGLKAWAIGRAPGVQRNRLSSLHPSWAVSEAFSYVAGDQAFMYSPTGKIAFLTGLLDEYDRLTGHTPTGIAPDAIKAAVEAYR